MLAGFGLECGAGLPAGDARNIPRSRAGVGRHVGSDLRMSFGCVLPEQCWFHIGIRMEKLILSLARSSTNTSIVIICLGLQSQGLLY